MQASTGVGIDVVVDESTAMAVFRWARPGRARAAGALVSRRACVEHGAGQTLKGFFFSSRSCLSFSVCLSPGCTNLRERLRRWLCDAGGQWVHGCMGAWGERQSDAASVARRAACRDGLAACRFLEDGRLAAGPMASSEHRPPQMALGYPRASRVVCRVRGGNGMWMCGGCVCVYSSYYVLCILYVCTYLVVRQHAMPPRAHGDLQADTIGWHWVPFQAPCPLPIGCKPAPEKTCRSAPSTLHLRQPNSEPPSPSSIHPSTSTSTHATHPHPSPDLTRPLLLDAAACYLLRPASCYRHTGSPWLPACAWRPTPTHSPLPQHQYRRALPRKLTILYASNSDCCWPGWLAASPLACPQRG